MTETAARPENRASRPRSSRNMMPATRFSNGCSAAPYYRRPVAEPKRDSYDAAQERKFDWHIDHRAPTPAQVLEVGVGWQFCRALATRNPEAVMTRPR